MVKARFPRLFSRVLLAGAVLLAIGCGRGRSGVSAAAPGDGGDRDEAAKMLALPALPDRFEVIALADRLAVTSVRAASKDEGAIVAALAAKLRERVFRVVHLEADGREAVALFDRAAESSDPAGACEAAYRRSVLLGELSHDPSVTLREAHASAKKLASVVCADRVDALTAALAPFRTRAGVPLHVPLPETSAAASVSAAPPSAPATSLGTMEAIATSPSPPPASSGPVSLSKIAPFGDVEAARIVVHLSGPTSFHVGTAPPIAGKGPRVYVDIDRAKVGKIKKELAVGGLVERVRVAPHGSGARVVLDLSRPASRRVFYLLEPFRIVFDVSTRPLASEGAETREKKGQKRKIARVVIDPGHGGHDPGATGPGGLREKDVTLDIAHRAAPVLARELGISTLLTRDKDEYVSLEERTLRANAFGADIFVSVHCNASESASARGVQTYVLDTTSDDVAARVAARENASSAQAGAEVSRLLSDLKLADLGSRSTHVAELLQRAAISSLGDKFPGATDQGVKTAGFYVLVGAEMPAVLFETSFISNAAEEERLGSGEYRQRLADAIVNAVRAYRDGR
jgi:N-acetylmuramoyl-L-alanine amidase